MSGDLMVEHIAEAIKIMRSRNQWMEAGSLIVDGKKYTYKITEKF